MAQAVSAMTIARFFTSVGVDPYDQFTWVKRDSKLTNPATGEVVFEQKKC